MFFKGYIKTKGKKAIERFKDVDDLHSLEEVQNFGEYAGILAQDTVLIDVDDSEMSQILLDIIIDENIACCVRKTNRGMHFFFKNSGAECFKQCYTNVNLACGLTADIKVGLKNSYSILKLDGVERAIIYDKFDDEEYAQVPFWLNVVQNEKNLYNLAEGDGRNSALFSYILNLQAVGLTIEEIKKTITIINKYVLKNPLSDKELDTILRDESFKKKIVPNFFNNASFEFDKFAKYLVKELSIKKINGLIHIYKDGYYQEGVVLIEQEIIKVLPALNRAKRTEVLEYIKLLCSENHEIASANYIAFKNGILDLSSDKMLPFSKDLNITNKIPYNYNTNSYSELLDNTLNKLSCNDIAIRKSLEELVGYCLYRRNELRKAFILVGDKANGKSTYLSIIQKALGNDNTSALDLKELRERFKTAELFNKLANIGDDIADDFISDASFFKKLVSGDRITAERKGKDPFAFNNYSKLIFSANNLPRINDKTGAVLSRIIIIPFEATFSKEDPDYRPFIKYELQQEDSIEYLLKLGVMALKNILTNNSFTIGERASVQLQNYDLLNNPILSFVDEYREENLTKFPIDTVYEHYNNFCMSNNFKASSKIEFSRQIRKRFKLESKTKRIGRDTARFFA